MNDQEFTNLVRQYSKLIFTVCQRFVKDYQEAEKLSVELIRAVNHIVEETKRLDQSRMAVFQR